MTVNVVASIFGFAAKMVVATTPNTRPKNVFKVGDTKRVVIEILSRYRKVAGDEAGMNGLRI